MLECADLLQYRTFWLVVGEVALLDGKLVVPNEVFDPNPRAAVLFYPFGRLVGLVSGRYDVALVSFGCVFVNQPHHHEVWGSISHAEGVIEVKANYLLQSSHFFPYLGSPRKRFHLQLWL